MLMGSNLIRLIFYVILMLQIAQGQNPFPNRVSLDSSIHDYALKNMSLGRSRTGILYDIPLPANFSGITISFVRVTSARIWSKGVNFSNVYTPPRTLTWPFSRRVDILYENLGNWSSFFYNVPNYTLVAPVIGFLAYYAANDSRTDYGMIEVHPRKDPIVVTFPNVSLPGDHVNMTMQCVRFQTTGEIEFANVTGVNSCMTWDHGHFSIVIPSSQVKRRKERLWWKWWEMGFAVGIVGLVLLVGFGLVMYKCCRMRKFGKLEKEAERSEALETIWIGISRMPSATSIRTQPIIENTYEP